MDINFGLEQTLKLRETTLYYEDENNIVKCLPRQYILPYRDVTLFLSAVKVLDSALRLIRKAVRNQRKRGTQCERDSYNFNFNIVHLPP